jgi:hypothetical protein
VVDLGLSLTVGDLLSHIAFLISAIWAFNQLS